MASEITVELALSFRKGSSQEGVDPGPISVTMTGTNFLRNRQTVGTSEEALLLGDVPAGGWVFMVNRDSSNYVRVKAATGATALIRLRAGEAACFRLDAGATAPFVQADTSAVELEYLLIED